MTTTNPPAAHARSYRVGNLDLNRIGYGAMRLAGPGVLARRTSAPPRPRRPGPWWNRASTTSTRPTPTGRTAPTRSSGKRSCRGQVHDNLHRLGLDVLDVVNLRTLAGIDDRATVTDTLTPQFEALAELQPQGLIRSGRQHAQPRPV